MKKIEILLFLVLIATFSSSCSSKDEKASVLDGASVVGLRKLHHDALLLAKMEVPKDGNPVPFEMWPESFQMLHPLEVLVVNDSVFIVTARHFQHRTELILQPESYGNYISVTGEVLLLAPGAFFISD